jgi:nucleoid DNA-binding protein
MPTKPPINIRELGKTGVLKEERFFQRLSEKNNYISKEMAREFYMGLVKVIVADLRENGVCRLPHIGDFAIVVQNKGAGIGKNGFTMNMGPTHALKFYANYALREYFRNMVVGLRDGQTLDPRNKVLGKQVNTS